MIHHNMIS